jgi:predicted NBD/HSP70 family sugar kinase
MPPARPSLELLRSLTDEHVLRALIEDRRLTRAELATRTGISKPTISDSVRRLAEAGLVVDTGERTTGRGRVGSYYALADPVGSALVLVVAPEGIVAELVDVYGDVITRAVEPISRPAQPDQVRHALAAAARAAQKGRPRPDLAVVSAADPVDRNTKRLVHLPDSPFLIGELSPALAIRGLVDGPVRVDNDVNWAARAERAAGDTPLDDAVYVHLGEGLGCAVIVDGEVRRGHTGLAGEIAHVVTTGPAGTAVPFTEVFAGLGLHRAGSTAIDVPELLTAGPRTVQIVARATAGVLAAAVAFADPELVVIGGSWGPEARFLEAIEAEFALLARHARVRAARVVVEPALEGARAHAVAELRRALLLHRSSEPE